MLVDQARIFVKAGDGGSGSSSFRREKYVPKGGPDGGDGGRGGDVILQVAENVSSLLAFQYVAHFRAGDGQAGTGQQKHGRKGESKVVKVPPGTVVYLEDGDEAIADLTEPAEEFVVARGGKGGLGNVHFKSSTRQAPRIAELGEPGEERWLRLELRLIADVGLVGLPNAGKSTLLAATTHATPKIADYPFTTLSPNLGVVEIGGRGGQAFVMADIPGLIEGAAAGAGLGHEFLRHVRRTKVLVHVLDASGGPEGRDPLADFRTVNTEVASFDPEMAEKPLLVVLNKIDLPEAQANVSRLRDVLTREGYEVYAVSAATGEGTRELFNAVGALLRDLPAQEAKRNKLADQKPRRRVYTLGNTDERAWEVERLSRHHFAVRGIGIERFTKMTNFAIPEGADRFQRTLESSGISAELLRQGVQNGDIVHIADFEMVWGNQEGEESLEIPDSVLAESFAGDDDA